MKPILIATLSNFLAAFSILAQDVADTQIHLPRTLPDPLERSNRFIWGLNVRLNKHVARPLGKSYRFLIRKPVRQGINNVAQNLAYPKRALNNILVGNWAGVRDETYRFLVDSTVGVGGLYRASNRWKIPQSDLAFADTLEHYGMGPGFYLVLPFLGATNARNGLGLIGDVAAHPLTYLPPYGYAQHGFTANKFIDQIEGFHRFSETEVDSYQTAKLAYDFLHRRGIPRESMGQKHPPSLETLDVMFVQPQDPKFIERVKERSVRSTTTGERLRYSCWLQPKSASCIYVIPGMGAHRMTNSAVSIAELVYRQGMHVVVLSSAFHSEFIRASLTETLPGYSPSDTNDLHRTILEVDHDLRRRLQHRMRKRAIMGYSMGAFHTLGIAASDGVNPPESQFDRYIAINPPVSLVNGAKQLDAFYRAPLEWAAEERTPNIYNMFLKAASLYKSNAPPKATSPPFNSIESRFLIGYMFRKDLRDIIFSSQYLHNLRVLKNPLHRGHRKAVYEEIMNYSFQDYFDKFVLPHFMTQGTIMRRHELDRLNDLRSYERALRANSKIRAITNQNDFLLEDEDIQWLRRTLNGNRLTIFGNGGHLGNLGSDDFREAIERSLTELE